MKILDGRYALQGIVEVRPWGRLWIGNDNELGRPLLVREISGRAFSSDKEVRHFVSCSYSLSQLHHPNLEQVLSLRRADDGSIFVFYAYSDSVSVASLLTKVEDNSLSPEFALFILGEAAKGLSAAHQARDRQTNRPLELYHLSLTTQHLELTSGSAVKVTGFGLAALDRDRGVEGSVYLAPEQIQSSGVDHRSDVYSLGAIGYEMIVGRKMWSQTNVSELLATIIRGEYDHDALRMACRDSEIEGIIERSLRLKKGERFASAAELADTIRRVIREKLLAADKKIREIVEKFAEKPKLVADEGKERQYLRTRILDSAAIDEGTPRMSDLPEKERDEGKKPRPGEKTVVTPVPVFKKVRRSGLGGRKSVFFLSFFAAILLLVIAVVVGIKLWQNRDITPPTVSDMMTGTLSTIPDAASVYMGDSLLGITPLTFSAKNGDWLTLKHPCCPDSNLEVNFTAFAATPVYLRAEIEIASDPTGAAVSINGISTGAVTPYRFEGDASDTIQIQLDLAERPPLQIGPAALSDLHPLVSNNVDVANLSGGRKRITGLFVERPKTMLTSSPSGAKVIMTDSGVEIGETPLPYEFPDNAVNLTFVKEGFEERIFEIPPAASRQKSYSIYLFRKVYVTAYEAGNVERTVNCRIKDVLYDSKSHRFTEITPASLRLPGVECRLILAADGYHDADTLLSPSQMEITVVMHSSKKDGDRDEKKSAITAGIPTDKGEVKIRVVDSKDVPVAGATVRAEFKRDKQKVSEELGTTDSDGRLNVLLSPGEYKFIAKHVDYKLEDKSKKIRAGESYELTIKIKRR